MCVYEIYMFVCTYACSKYVCVHVCIYVCMYEITECLFFRYLDICALTQLIFLKYIFVYISLISHLTTTATRTLTLLDAYNLLSSLQ
jgi:hypothetical protein